jgi:hypothetical protein
MKKIILATALLVALSTASFAGGNRDKKLLNDLQTTLKYSSQVQWTSTSDYSSASFSFNGKRVSAYYFTDNTLIGFGIRSAQSELPKEVSDAISKKYSNWTIIDAMLFIEANADVCHYVQVRKGKTNLALKIANGHAYIFSRMFPKINQ